MCMYIDTHKLMHTHIAMKTHSYAHILQSNAHTHTDIQAHIEICTLMHILPPLTHTHTHTHTHTQYFLFFTYSLSCTHSLTLTHLHSLCVCVCVCVFVCVCVCECVREPAYECVHVCMQVYSCFFLCGGGRGGVWVREKGHVLCCGC